MGGGGGERGGWVGVESHAVVFFLRLVHPFWIFGRESFNISSIKCRLITKLIIDLVCKLRDESSEPN